MCKKTICLTGGTGYLGSNILKSLIKNGYNTILLKRSFSDTSKIEKELSQIISYDINLIDLKQIFIENKIDILLHCATDYGRKNDEALKVIDANLLLPVKLLELCKKNKVKCFINTDTILDKRVNYYSLSKRQFEEWLTHYVHDMICVSVKLEHFYGPGDDVTKFVSFIINSMVTNIDKIDLTEGNQKRNFIYIDDVVDGFIKIIENIDLLDLNYYEYEMGSDTTLTIRKFVELVKNNIPDNKTYLNFGGLPYRKNEVMECFVNTSEISKLGWVCNTPLEEGIKKTIEYERKKLKK